MVAGVERERKFLVPNVGALPTRAGRRIAQKYLFVTSDVQLRIRSSSEGFTLTLKGGGTEMERMEEELLLESRVLGALLLSAGHWSILKDRIGIMVDDSSAWVIDVFLGENEGLILAEIELDAPPQAITIPDWCGDEVTGNPLFYNSNLAREPVSTWTPRRCAKYQIVRPS